MRCASLRDSPRLAANQVSGRRRILLIRAPLTGLADILDVPSGASPAAMDLLAPSRVRKAGPRIIMTR